MFFNEPYREFHLREVAGTAKVSSSTAKRFLDFYSERGFLQKRRRANLALFKANLENPAFIHIKIGHLFLKLQPLVDRLKEIYPQFLDHVVWKLRKRRRRPTKRHRPPSNI